MKRTLVDLEEKAVEGLDGLAGGRATSRAAVLREAVADYLVRHAAVPPQAAKPLEGFGVLQGRLGDGQDYQDQLRSEWD